MIDKGFAATSLSFHFAGTAVKGAVAYVHPLGNRLQDFHQKNARNRCARPGSPALCRPKVKGQVEVHPRGISCSRTASIMASASAVFPLPHLPSIATTRRSLELIITYAKLRKPEGIPKFRSSYPRSDQPALHRVDANSPYSTLTSQPMKRAPAAHRQGHSSREHALGPRDSHALHIVGAVIAQAKT
jgi:hypothetical protein